MTLFRYNKNGLLYVIEFVYGWQQCHIVTPYKHTIEIGGKQKHNRRKFVGKMSMNDFTRVTTDAFRITEVQK